MQKWKILIAAALILGFAATFGNAETDKTRVGDL